MTNFTLLSLLKQDNNEVLNISNSLNVSKLSSRLLINRGITDLDKCIDYINPSLDKMLSPFLLKDMEIAVNRIISSINKNENIWIYGDYDVDGVTSTSVLKIFFSSIGVNANYYIPDRFSEGYGLNKEAMDYIIHNNGDLVITVDCGITSTDVVNHCNDKNLDIIITDHHTCQEELPKALAIINPNRPDCEYPFKKLAGVGVALKLIQAISIKLDLEVDYDKILPIVALGTVADVVPLVGENRIIVKHGLDLISRCDNNGIKALLNVTGLTDKKITAGHIGFVIGPRINATGRLDSAKYGVELLICDNYDDALLLAKKLDDENKKRQEIEGEILKEAEEILSKRLDYENEIVLVIDSNDWNHGVIGIVSSRITEKYYKPSVMISIENDEGRGSARSISSFDIFDSMNKCKDLFNKFGGHKQAAGLSIPKENINEFRKRINEIANETLTKEDLLPVINVDTELNIEDITLDNVKELSLLEPFGMGNPSPIFLIKDAFISSIRKIGKEENHLKLIVNFEGESFDCVGFNLGYLYDDLFSTDKIDIVGSLDINEFRGNIKIQFLIKEIVKDYLGLVNFKENFYDSFLKITLKNYKNLSEYNFNKTELNKNNYRLKTTIDKLRNNEKVLVIVNTYESAIDLSREIGCLGREVLKRTEVSFNSINREKVNSVVINPCLNDIELNSFDEVIVYDLYDSSILSIDKYKLKNLSGYSDYENFIKNLDNIIPTIEELREIYKTLTKYNSITLDLRNMLINNVKFTNNNLNRWKLEISLKIFNEANLILCDKVEDFYKVKLRDNKSKINILEVPLYKYLLNIKS